MGIDLPFLPFDTREERKKFAQCILSPDFPKSDDAAAIAWCKFVDDVNIFPKLPVHIRTYREKFQRNERVRQSVENAREGNEKLAELNNALTAIAAETICDIPIPRPMPDPKPQAMHISPYVVVGGVAVGQTPSNVPVTKQRGTDKKKRQKLTCKYCEKNGGEFFQVCGGRTARGACSFYDQNDGAPILCEFCSKDTCKSWLGKKRECRYFESDGTPKQNMSNKD